jgi:hypothetical protein
MPIKVRHNGLDLDGKILPLVALEIPFSGVSPEAWGPALDRAKAMGFNVITFTITPESEGGVEGFLALAAQKDFKVMAQYRARLESAGDIPESLGRVLGNFEYPEGPVVAIQAGGPAGPDSPEAELKLFHDFLNLKYRQIKVLNAAWHTNYASFEEAGLPSAGSAGGLETLKPLLDVPEFREYAWHLRFSLTAERLKESGLRSPLFQSLKQPLDPACDIPDLEKDSGIDFCAVEPSGASDNNGAVADLARFLFMSSGLACVLRVSADSDLLQPFMGGARSVTFFLPQGMESDAGLAGRLTELNKFLHTLDWTSSFPQVQALLLETRESVRTGQACQGLENADKIFGADDPGPAGQEQFRQAAMDFIRDRQLTWARAASSLPPEKLKKPSLILLACRGFLDEAFAKRLRAFVESGGLLIVGPQLPVLNQRLEPLSVFKDLEFVAGKPTPVGDGKMLVCQGAFDAKAAASMVQRAKLWSEVSFSHKSLDLGLHRLGGRQVLFARNPHADTRNFTVNKEGKFVLKPLWAGGKFLGAVEEREVSLNAGETKVWEVIPC